MYGTRLRGPVYCDASALLTVYVAEPDSRELNRVLEGRRDVMVSDLAITEVVSAVARRARERSLTGEAARGIQHMIVTDVENGLYRRLELTRDVHREAERLLITLPGTPLRAADALHIALATSARAATLASFDARRCAAAAAIGLTTYPVTPTRE